MFALVIVLDWGKYGIVIGMGTRAQLFKASLA